MIADEPTYIGSFYVRIGLELATLKDFGLVVHVRHDGSWEIRNCLVEKMEEMSAVFVGLLW